MRNLATVLLCAVVSVVGPMIAFLLVSEIRFSSAKVHVVDLSFVREMRQTLSFDSYEDSVARRNVRSGNSSWMISGANRCSAEDLPDRPTVKSGDPMKIGSSLGAERWIVVQTQYIPVKDVRSGRIHPSDSRRTGAMHLLPYRFTNTSGAWIEKDLKQPGVLWSLVLTSVTLFTLLVWTRYRNLFKQTWRAGVRTSQALDHVIDRANTNNAA